ncbi:MAG: ornithine cyclodeaminase family protein [Alphaproteobacteria bacterium]|nr:ornithine cyclodeaminase family protein [Alphaproteobacteria bacterium]
MRAIDAAAVERALDYPSLIARLRVAFRDGCAAPLRHHHAIPTPDGGTGVMLLKPAWRTGGRIVVKVINIFPENGARGLPSTIGTVLVFDATTGMPVAVVDGTALTVRRTAAASALAADYLARADAATFLMVGTGQLAPALVAAHASVRRYRRVLVWGRDAAKAAAFAARLDAAGVTAAAAPDLEAAVRSADTISCATLATEPLVRGVWLRAGSHLDLVGSFTPAMREADDAAMARARIHVDTRAGALAETGDLIGPIERGVIGREAIVAELAELCAGTVAGRRTAAEITVFKSVGTALEDYAAAELVSERIG